MRTYWTFVGIAVVALALFGGLFHPQWSLLGLLPMAAASLALATHSRWEALECSQPRLFVVTLIISEGLIVLGVPAGRPWMWLPGVFVLLAMLFASTLSDIRIHFPAR